MEKYNRVAIVLKEKGISQKWIAEQIGKSTNSVSAICRNDSQPKLGTLYAIAKALEVNVCDLLINNEEADD